MEVIRAALPWVLGIATVLGGVAALLYFREKWRARSTRSEKGKEQIRDQLAAFLVQAQRFRKRLDEFPLPIGEHNAWVDSVQEWLRDNLGKSYAVRFGDFSGITFYGSGSERSKMSRSIQGRSQRLDEFISRLSG